MITTSLCLNKHNIFTSKNNTVVKKQAILFLGRSTKLQNLIFKLWQSKSEEDFCTGYKGKTKSKIREILSFVEQFKENLGIETIFEQKCESNSP